MHSMQMKTRKKKNCSDYEENRLGPLCIEANSERTSLASQQCRKYCAIFIRYIVIFIGIR